MKEPTQDVETLESIHRRTEGVHHWDLDQLLEYIARKLGEELGEVVQKRPEDEERLKK